MEIFPNLIAYNKLNWSSIVFLKAILSMCLFLPSFSAIAGNSESVSQEDQKFLISISKEYGCWIGTLDLSMKDDFAAILNVCVRRVNALITSQSDEKIRDREILSHVLTLQQKFPIPLPNQEHVKRLQTGENCSRCDLRGANLSDTKSQVVDLSFANLSSADLTKSNFAGSNLSNVNFRSANMSQGVQCKIVGE
jgi:hypothetical protein